MYRTEIYALHLLLADSVAMTGTKVSLLFLDSKIEIKCKYFIPQNRAKEI